MTKTQPPPTGPLNHDEEVALRAECASLPEEHMMRRLMETLDVSRRQTADWKEGWWIQREATGSLYMQEYQRRLRERRLTFDEAVKMETRLLDQPECHCARCR